ncbi:Microtubule-nucleating Tub4p (gamma-tubulin) complex component [Dimargaris cristalligena]|nr:Microtubule-nucleating Tub4p (gamma-tubulin) complex component [Dimargaris cristalligena]
MESEVLGTLGQLVDCFLSLHGEPVSIAKRDSVLKYCSRILSSRMTPSVVADEAQISDLIKKKLARDASQMQNALRFSQLYARIQSKDVLTQRWSILYLLYSLSNSNAPADSNVSASNRYTQMGPLKSAFSSFGLQTIDRADSPSSATAPLTERDPRLALTNPAHPDSHQLAPARPPQPRPLSKYVDHTTAQPASPAPLSQLVPSTSTASELDLMTDLVYAFQGIDGQLIHYDRHQGAFRLPDSCRMDAPVRALVHHLATLGEYFRQVKGYIVLMRKTPSVGHVVQSFTAYLDQELTEHLKFVALLENQLVNHEAMDKMLRFNINGVTSTPAHTEEATATDAPAVWTMAARTGLTLRRLKVWLQPAFKKLHFFAQLAEKCRDKRAGPILNEIHIYTDHGDPFIRDLANDILKTISVPFYEIVEHWIYNGELLDPHQESFIAVISESNTNAWKSKFELSVLNIPIFIQTVVATKIFLIGKSVHFLRFHCQDGAWINQQCRVLRNEIVLSYADSFAVEVSIDRVYRTVCRRLLDVMFNKYKLMDHFWAMKRYLLLGQGDFVQCLLKSIGPELSKPAGQVYRHNLNAGMESAIRASNAQYEDPVILRQLDFHLLQKANGDAGWDIFELQYVVPPPMDQFLLQESIKPYSKLFAFLWKLKYVEHELSKLWRKQTTCSRTVRRVPFLAGDIHRCHIATHEMTHFLNQLQCFILYEVIEKAWTAFMYRINKGLDDLDLLIAAHKVYIMSITKLLVHKRVNYLQGMVKILDVIFQFRNAVDNLYDFALMEANRYSASSTKAATTTRSTRKPGGNTNNPPSAAENSETPRVPERLLVIRQQYTTAIETFQRRVTDLLTNLTEQQDANLKFLAVRLNFNEVYQVPVAASSSRSRMSLNGSFSSVDGHQSA